MIVSMYLREGEIMVCDECGAILEGEGTKVNMELDWYFEYAIKKCCSSCLEDD